MNEKKIKRHYLYELNTNLLDCLFAFIVSTEQDLPLFVGAVKKI